MPLVLFENARVLDAAAASWWIPSPAADDGEADVLIRPARAASGRTVLLAATLGMHGG